MSERVMSSSPGRPNFAGSWLADPISGATRVPTLTVVPPTSASRTVIRPSACTGRIVAQQLLDGRTGEFRPLAHECELF